LKILSIDGGGYRGIFAAHVLKRIEQKFSASWPSDFSLIAGTSTGSIIAAGLACGLSAHDICELYRINGHEIFKKRPYSRLGLTSSRYRSANLKNILTDVFTDKRLGDVKTPLLIPSTDIGNGCVHVLKSAYDPGFFRDPDVLIVDAILASCSAPTYFDPYITDRYMLADGGLWANNPSLIATVEAKRRLGAKLEDLEVLSIGTGTGKKYYSQRPSFFKRMMGWGFATRWGGTKFINMILNLQSETASNTLQLLLEKDQIVRVNFTSDNNLSLDDPGMYADLCSKADKEFTYNSSKIAAFFTYQRSKELHADQTRKSR